MPGPYIHMSAARHAARALDDGFHIVGSDRIDPEWSGPEASELADLLREHPNFAALGAIGPDLFFFLADFRDQIVGGVRFPVSSVLVTVLNFVESVYSALDPYITKYEKYLGPISEDTAEELSRLTGGLSESVGNISGELSAILTNALADFVTQQGDILEFFSLGLNHGYDEQAYFWSDMLHYRQTGAFAQALWRNAVSNESDEHKAYALGYLSHVAADTVAHAFVNQVAGGPFRVHWQRHHLVENHADAHWYLNDDDSAAPRNTPGYDELTESALYFDIAFGEGRDEGAPVARPSFPVGDTLRDNYVRRRTLDIDSKLSPDLADLLIKTITDIYYAPGVPHPAILRGNDGRPDTELVQNTYDLLFRFLKLTTVDGFKHEPPPPPEWFPNLDFPTPSDPAGDQPPGPDDGGDFWDDLLDFVLSVINALGYVVQVAIYLATLPWAIIADVVTYPLRTGLYYALELPLFYLLKYFRAVLVRTGYLMPTQDEIDQSLIRVGNRLRVGWQDLLTDAGDIFGGLLDPGPNEDTTTPARDLKYPYEHETDEFRHPWQYPDGAKTATETCPATAGPHGEEAGPRALFRGITPSADIRDRLETATAPTPTAQTVSTATADVIDCDITPTNNLGDLITMTTYTMWLATRFPDGGEGGGPVPLTDWNLDADRGYGYHCWDWNRLPANPDPNHDPQDPEGNRFREPCTWPSQEDDGHRYHSGTPLEIHWAGPGLPDPGCVKPECVEKCPPPVPPVPPVG
ncbi:zinc dependent phospholipase C family protein, partial [Planosporangium thailandense]